MPSAARKKRTFSTEPEPVPAVYHLPDGRHIGADALAELQKTVDAYKEAGMLDEELCLEILKAIPATENRLIVTSVKQCARAHEESVHLSFWDWIMIFIVHTLQQYKARDSQTVEDGEIYLWRESTPQDLLNKIRSECTAIGTLIQSVFP